jgi:hypothetical protein
MLQIEHEKIKVAGLIVGEIAQIYFALCFFIR